MLLFFDKITFNNKNLNTKINICKELLNILSIEKLEGLNKNVIEKFTTEINNVWFNENINNI